MKTKAILYLFFLVLFFSTCNKAKLKGEWAVLEGRWHWYRGWGDGGTTELKLDLKERGRYKLFRNKEKIEYGRLVKKDGYVKFISEKLWNNKDLLLDTKMITYMDNDSIHITKTDCTDCALSTFRKN